LFEVDDRLTSVKKLWLDRCYEDLFFTAVGSINIIRNAW